MRTQCYSMAALRDVLDVDGFEVESISRVEYAWSTEINDCRVPRSAPRPFDWLAVVRRAAPDEHNDADRATDDGRTGRPPSRASR